MKTTKKLLALLLALVMLMSVVPMGVFAAEVNGLAETTTATEADTTPDETTEATEEPEATTEPTVEATTEATEEPVEETTDPTESTEIALLMMDDEPVDENLGKEYVYPRDTSGDPLYKILHIDAGRKYTSLASLKTMVDYVAINGMNQIDLYLSDNQGLRFGVTDSNGKFIISANGTTYDLTPALGYYDNSAAEPSKSTDKINNWLSPAEMKELILYAAAKGVDIVPSINMPGHMAAILQGSGDERISAFGKTFWSQSESTHYSNESLDMGNVEAVNFALALLDAYCSYFYGITDANGNPLIKYFSIAADEYGQDLEHFAWGGSGFGTAYMNANGEYDDLVQFLNRAGNVIKSYGMTPRAFNDAFLSDGNTNAAALGLDTDYQLYYWGGGWGGMKNADPDVLNDNGFKVINCNSNYYYICCHGGHYGSYIDTVEAIRNKPFELKTFATGAVSFNPAGAMFCIWCDHCTGGASHETDVTGNAMEVMAEWAACLSAVPDENYEYVEKTDATGVKVGAAGLSEIAVDKLDTNPTILAATAGKVQTYSVQMLNAQRDYTGSYRVFLPIPDGWNAAKVRGFTVGELVAVMSADNEATLPVREANGNVKDGYYVLDVDTPYAAVGIYEAADAPEGQKVVNITLNVGDTYDLGTLTGDYRAFAKAYGAFKIEQTGFTDAVAGTPAVAPTAADMGALVSGESYLISDGNGNYLSFTAPSTITNSADPLTATKWKVTVNSDGTYSFSTSYVQWGSTSTAYLALLPWDANTNYFGISSSNNKFSYDSTNGLNIPYGFWDGTVTFCLGYTGSSWGMSKGAPSGAAAAIYTPGTEGTPDVPATTTLRLTATEAGTASVTIDNTTYNITVVAAVTSARCEEHDITVSGHGVDGLTCAADSSVTSVAGYESVAGVKITGYSLTPTVDNAAYKGEVQVKMPVPADWLTEGGVIQAFLKQDAGTAAIPVTIENGYATYTVPGGTVSGLFKLPAGYFTKEVNVLMGDNSTVTRLQQGAYTDKDVYYCDDKGFVTVTSEVTSPYVPALPAGIVSAINVGDNYVITDGNGNYLTIENGQMANTNDPDKAAKWNCHSTDSGTYRLISGGYNLNNTGSGFFISTDGGANWWSPYFDPELGLYKNGQYLVFKDGAWTTSADSTGHSIVYGTGSDAVPAKSTVTITSHDQNGTTSVIVGTVKYNITIADKSLVDSKVRIHSMITNDLVLIGGSDASPVCHVDVNAAMPGVNTEEGIDITKLFPTNAVRKDDRMVFWKMTWLPAGNHQGTESGSPYLTGDYEGGIAGQTSTMTGYASRVDFTRLRYYEGRWEFYLDAELDAWDTGAKWGKDKNGDGVITAEESQGWYPVNPTEAECTELNMSGIDAGEGQIVAYYLQVTDVTREVITNVADWGPAIDDSRNIGYGKNYVLLDFAVRYEDGVRNPNETGTFPYSEGSYNTAGEKYTTDKTMGFHCTEGWGDVEKRDDGTLWRKINTIMATTDKIDGYEIYMITTTRSDETKQLSDVDMSQNKRSSDGSGGYDYDTKTETVVWLKDENVRYNTEEFLLDENVAYGYRENGTHTSGVPLVDSVTIQNEHAVLVTYYVRYVGNTEDALHVHYINRSLNNIEFYNYGIRVKSGTLFDTTFARTDSEYGLTGNTVVNYYDVAQTVQGDPREILDVPSFYRSTKLTLVEVRRSEDGKDLYLYYDTDNAKDMVVDFGLPVEITEKSLQLELNQDETLRYITAIDGTETETVQGKYYVQKAEYGYFYTDLATGQCYYIPFTVMRGTESMRMAVTTDKTTSSNPHRYVMSVFPATTVYYEEYFAKYEGTWTGNTTRPDMGENYVGQYMGQQQGAYPGMTDAYNYGYDTVYGGDAKTEAATTTPGSKATFEFTGNGFEICADCTTSTGTVMVALYKVDGQTEKMKSMYMVNTVRQSGESALTQYEGESHNTPIVSVRDLEYGDYKVVMVLTNYSAANFVFDGFRVFNTMDSAIDGKVYDKDAESQPEFVEVRDNVLVANLPNKDAIDKDSVYINQIAKGVSGQVYTLKGDQKVTAVLMTEGGAALKDADVTDYLDNGTKNEVYVRPGQYLLITLPSEEIAAKTQIGLKTLTGTATLGSKTISQTNMYYEGMNDGATIKIQNPGGTASIISVTDLKVPGGIPADSTADTQSLQSGVRQALLWMGYKEEPQPTEPQPTDPEVTEPKVTEPVTTEPKPTEPAPTEPKATEPKPTEPAPTEPKVTEPKPTEPAPTEPGVTEPKPTEPSTVVPGDTYVSEKAYHRGDTVVFNGKTYRAKWWTRGENPEKSQVWELVDDGNQTAAPAAWSPFKIYTAGMQVTYKGRVYEAKWWTIGLAPGKGWWSAWKQIS